MTKIKICGLRREEDIDIVNLYMPDYIGFVFAKSKRQVDVDKAMILKEKLSKNILVVGVFVNEEIRDIVKIVKMKIIDIIQLHGDEDCNYIMKLKEEINVPVIKAIRVRENVSIDEKLISNTDYLLYDTYAKEQYGGSGVAFDWSMLNVTCNSNYFLAGGIGEHNVEEAIKTLNPYCIDVSSFVETDGYKDPDKIREIIFKVRSVSK